MHLDNLVAGGQYNLEEWRKAPGAPRGIPWWSGFFQLLDHATNAMAGSKVERRSCFVVCVLRFFAGIASSGWRPLMEGSDRHQLVNPVVGIRPRGPRRPRHLGLFGLGGGAGELRQQKTCSHCRHCT